MVQVDNAAERVVEHFRKFVLEVLEERADLPSREVPGRPREAGYRDGKTARYGCVASLRPKPVRPLVLFEGLPGEFSQHDFGRFNLQFIDGTARRVHFFASRLKYSQYVRVSLVEDEVVET